MASTRFHWVRLRAACHATEDPGKVKEALRFVSGLGEEDFAPTLRSDPMESHHGAQMQMLEAVLGRSRLARDVLRRLLELPGAREQLAATADARTDDDGVFYVRVGKQAAFQGRLVLTQGEDCVQVRFRPESYPATREAALQGIRAALSE